MLSVENPPDPSCSTKSSQLKNDERASDGLALQVPDLLKKQGLGGTDKFSIRDYAFAARSKDICASWPFHKKHLQICLKHGIKDPLPPFETPDSVRNQCSSKIIALGSDQLGRNTVGEEGSFRKENASNLDGESCPRFDPSVLVSADEAPSQVQEKEKFTVSEDRSLCQLVPGLDQGEKGHIPLRVSHAQCRGSESSPTSRFPLSAPNTLPEASVELEVAGAPCTLHKPGIAIESKGKKCRLIVKLGSISNLSNTNEHTLNTTTISDSMASKVCPVCKMFSSTSNTALNAHIDQCLAVESTSKLALNSKLGKHRVKPRKKRSMVDICASAPRCTLEELDRRNGSNWAADLRMSSASVEVRTEGKKQRLSNMPLEDDEEDNAVYFDSNGTKIRILSKFKDTPVSTVGKDFKPRKHMRDCKDIKNFSTVKRRRIAPRHSKYMNLKLQTESLSQKPDRAEIYGASGGKHGMEESLKKEESLSQLLKVCDQIKPSESRAVGQWACSKRTGLSKKFCGQDGSHNPDWDCSSLELMDSLDSSDQLNLRNYSMERSQICKLPNSSSEDPTSSPKSKKVGSLSYGAPVISNKKKCSRLAAGGLSRLSNGSTSSELDGCMPKLSRSLRNHAGSPRRMRIEIHADPVKSSNGLPKMASQQSRTSHLLSAKGKKSTLKKKMLLVREASPMTKVNEKGSHFIFKKSRMHKSMAKTVDQVQAFSSDLVEDYDEAHEGHNFVENQFGYINQMEETHRLDPNNIFESETRESIDGVTLGKDNAVEHGCCYCSKNAPDMFDGQEPGTEETHVGEKDTAIRLSPGNTVRGSTVSSDRNFSSESHELGTCSDIRSINLSSIGKHKRPMCGTETHTGPTELYLTDDLEMDFADEIGSFSTGKTDRSSEAGLKVRLESSLSEVDVIPIPGPPGSFLPSPRGSEVLQGSSSHNSSRVSSFQDRYFLADRDLSGSPVSATSSISHPHMEGTDLKHSELESHARSPLVQDKIASFSYCSNNPVVRDSTISPGMVSMDGVERTNFERENVKFTMISPSMGPLEYLADQTCCCSRKEGTSRGAALVHEKSTSPGQCRKTPAILNAMGNQMISEQSTRPEMLASFSICPNSRIDEMLAPVLELPTSPIALKNSLAAALNFPGLNDSDFASPSAHAHPQTTSHPVLRLMGKNLMVVNKDEDTSMKLREIMPGAPSGGPNANYLALLGYSNVNAPNEDCVSNYHTTTKGPVIGNQDSCNTSSQFYDFGLPNGFRDLCNSEAHQKLPLSQGVNCSNMPVGGSAASSLQHHLLHQEEGLNRKPNPPFTYVDRVFSSPQPQQRSAVPATEAVAGPIHEVIIIDGSPENDADSRMRNAKPTEGLRGSQPSPVGILASTASGSNLTQVSPFPCFQSRNAYMLRQPPVRPKPSFLVSCPGGDANPVKWKGTFEVSSALSRGPVIAPQARRVI
ncbi:uncharacterized protein LOC122652542 [Telopea speciosissima]|uniref:uncharacterized protein LOC122652542 n=1 Tax=Telopea speciosissima TaxID=54955 RepID=UPI001CC4D777|nr:uncharacterized protein LOC122652542 [Telopea speciosissima]